MTARVLRGAGRDGLVCVPAIASEWDKPGIRYGKTVKQCTREQTWGEYGVDRGGPRHSRAGSDGPQPDHMRL